MFACAHWGAVGEFAASRHGVITRKQAAELGVSPAVVSRRVAQGYLREPVAGVLVVCGSVDSWHQRLAIATSASNAVGVVGFRSAAALHRLDGYDVGPVEIIAPNQRASLARVATTYQRRIETCDLTVINGLRCTSIARTLTDIASVDPLPRVTTAFECAWRRGASLVWIEQTARRLQRPGQRGTKVILKLVEEAAQSRPTESALEVRLAAVLVGLKGLVRQHEVRDANGRFIARTDFALPQLRLAIEAHSREFHFAATAVTRDEEREHKMKQLGWEVMYVGSGSLRSPGALRMRVDAIVARRLGELTSYEAVTPTPSMSSRKSVL